MSYSRWIDRPLYAFWHCASKDTKDSQLLSVSRLDAREVVYTYPECLLLRQVLDEFISDVDTEFEQKEDA